MGGEGKLNTRRGMLSSAAGRIEHNQYISWQARQKTRGLVRPQRPGATYSYEQKIPSPPESVANQQWNTSKCAANVEVSHINRIDFGSDFDKSVTD